MKQEKSCGCFVLNKSGDAYRILLLKHKNGGHWAFPKGHVEDGENEHQTALREVKEETGLNVKISSDVRLVTEYSPKPSVIKQVVYFAAFTDSDEINIQLCEIGDFKWVALDEACGIITFENDKKLFRKFRKIMKI